jgi:hypothetical protein
LRQAYDYWQDQPGFSGVIELLCCTRQKKEADQLVVTELTATVNNFCTEVHEVAEFFFHTNDSA